MCDSHANVGESEVNRDGASLRIAEMIFKVEKGSRRGGKSALVVCVR